MDKTIKEIKEAINTARAIGFAIGVLRGVLLVDLPDDTRKAIEEGIEGLEGIKFDKILK